MLFVGTLINSSNVSIIYTPLKFGSIEMAVELTTWQELFSHLPLFSSTFINESTLKYHEIMELPKLLGMKSWKNTQFWLSEILKFLFLEIFLERVKLDEVYENLNWNVLFIDVNFLNNPTFKIFSYLIIFMPLIFYDFLLMRPYSLPEVFIFLILTHIIKVGTNWWGKKVEFCLTRSFL